LDRTCGRGFAGWFAHQQIKRLPGEEPFEAAQDVLVAEPFCFAALGVGPNLLIPAQHHHSDAMRVGVGLAIATPIQPVMTAVACTRLQAAFAADSGESRL